jgi:hypothetical protein
MIESSEVMDKWIIPILTNIIAAIIMSLTVLAVRSGKKLSSVGRITWKVTSRLKPRLNVASMKYTAFVFFGIFPVGYNIWWLYSLVKPPSTPSRLEVLAIFFAAISVLYWSRDMWHKYTTYSLSDFAE